MVPTKLTPAAFVLAMLSFALPFATISCQGQTVTTMTGIQALTGSTVQGGGQSQDIPRDSKAIAAFIAALVGAALAFMGKRQLAGFAGVAGVVLLFLFKSGLESKVTSEGQGAFAVSFMAGFWLAMLALAVGAVLSFVRETQPATATAPAPGPTQT